MLGMYRTADEKARDYIASLIWEVDPPDKNTFTKHWIDTRAKYKVWSQNKDVKIGSQTIGEWWAEYLRERAEVMRAANYREWVVGIRHKLPIAYRSRSKQKQLLNAGFTDSHVERISQKFPLAANASKYSLHHVAPPNSWIVDVVFFGQFAYYAFININTRYLYIYPANARRNGNNVEIFASAKEATGTDCYDRVLQKFLPDNPNARLTGDGEKAFTTSDPRIQRLYQQFNVTFTPVKRLILNTRRRQKTQPYHSSLAILDAVVRTLRDMAYNVNLGEDVDPIAMNELALQYNSAPHATLTKYGPSFPISPNMAARDANLEVYICRRISQENMEIKRTQDFNLPIGTRCLVYNDVSPLDKRRSSARPEYFIITHHEHGKYQLRGEKSGVTIWLPRFKIKPVQK